MTNLMKSLNADFPLCEVARSLRGTGYEFVVVRVAEDGTASRVFNVSDIVYAKQDGDILIPVDFIRDYTDEDDKWEALERYFE